MTEKEKLPGNANDSGHKQQVAADAVIGKIDMSRSITENPCDGEGDCSDTTEMEKLSE